MTPWRQHLRTAARIVGIVAAAVWAIPGLAAVVSGEVLDVDRWEAAALAALVVLNAVGVALTRSNEPRGIALLLVAAPAFSLFALLSTGRNEVLTAIVSGGPFLLCAVLLLFARTEPSARS